MKDAEAAFLQHSPTLATLTPERGIWGAIAIILAVVAAQMWLRGWGGVSGWIVHDGAGLPEGMPNGARIDALVEPDGLYRPQGPTRDHSCWFWRWRRVRVGWFRTERRRVCDDPRYSPIIAYRIQKPEALTLLERIAENPREVEIA